MKTKTKPAPGWQQYEQAKKNLQYENLTPEEYEKRLRELAKEMGI